jgi:hypothetical protein
MPTDIPLTESGHFSREGIRRHFQKQRESGEKKLYKRYIELKSISTEKKPSVCVHETKVKVGIQ